MADGKRPFRKPESYEAERFTRNCIKNLLESRGFANVIDERRAVGGEGQSQLVTATDPSGQQIKMRVRLCWKWAHVPIAKRKTSASQITARVNGDWVGGLDRITARDAAEGVTHSLVVQGDEVEILMAALIPINQLRPIWLKQRDVSIEGIARGKMGRLKQNHSENGDSPTIWLKDERSPGGKSVTDVLWSWPGVEDVVKLTVVHIQEVDDTFDDLPTIDFSLYGSDGAPRIPTTRSEVKRDRNVRREVIKRASNGCERASCTDTRRYPGFLDVHHILGIEKSDRVWNCVALCPNCHREAHFAVDRDDINHRLLVYAKAFKRSNVDQQEAAI
ncbi:HNH endonuclease signature motif containing protein [Variovorax sp. IB41]|uniref:HNH endonuclease signature motif containing protein n=1 Tax=Variovorax sp. IB41 TaxID=2779370 RepID=UPI0018E85563|nr:HNH endonuclease signature motif containing protein [Variovorax sp. IB41]MBJ2160272.1 HNH endonuclease [Variovorax sp. IB41]